LENSIAHRANGKQEPPSWSKVESPYEWRGTNSLERTYFMGGKDPGEAILVEKVSYPAIPHTAQKIDAARIGDLGLRGIAVYGLRGWGSFQGETEGRLRTILNTTFGLRGIHCQKINASETKGISTVFFCLGIS
jgi:hypothetical protein